MDGKQEQIVQRGIERNASDEVSKTGAMQELFNMRMQDGAWRQTKKKKKIGDIESQLDPLIGWFSHPSTNSTTFVTYGSITRRVKLVDYEANTITAIKKRNGDDFILPQSETFTNFGHLENVLILFSSEQMYRFLWINGAFEYVEFGDIEWTCEKGSEIDVTISEATTELVIGEYQMMRFNDVKIGYIEGICAFRLAVEMFDGGFEWYSDVKILRGTGQIGSIIPNVSNFYFKNCYEPSIYVPENSDPRTMKYTAYRPKIQFDVPEWFQYYNQLGLVKAIHVCSTSPRYPYVPEFATGLWYVSRSFVSAGSGVSIDVLDLLPSTKPKILFIDETDLFYSLFSVNENQSNSPSATQAFDYSFLVSNLEIPIDNFTGNKTTSKYNFLYNQRLHLEQVTNTLPAPYEPSNDYFPNYVETVPTSGVYEPVEPDDYEVTDGYDMYIENIVNVSNNYYVVRRKITKIHKIATSTAEEQSVWLGRQNYYPHINSKFIRITFSKDGENFYTYKNPSYKQTTSPVNVANLAKTKTSADIIEGFTPALYTDFEPIVYWENPYTTLYYDLLFLKLSVPPAGTDYETSPLCEKVMEEDGRYIDTNRVQLSELGNPFLFPAVNSYRFGDINNKVMGVEVPREQLSETRFGQFPLYVFTTQGIWVMEQGQGNITYANSYYLDKYICTSNDLIKAIQGFVCFSTAEGLYIVSGRQFNEISTQLEGNISPKIQALPQLETLLNEFNDGTTNWLYISNEEIKKELPYMIMCHDYINKEVIYSPALKTYSTGEKRLNYSYVYDTVTRMWHKISEQFRWFIDTSPNVVGVKYRTEIRADEKEGIGLLWHLYDFYDMHAEEDYTDVKLAISKPITFGTMIYKRIEQLLMRMFLKNVTKNIGGVVPTSKMQVFIFGSLDGNEYRLLQGGELTKEYINDLSLRRVFVDCKYFIIAYSTKHEFVEMLAFEAVVKPKFTKTLR